MFLTLLNRQQGWEKQGTRDSHPPCHRGTPGLQCTLRRAPAPTDTMQEELGLGGEAVVDDIVQHGDVEPASGHVGDQQHWALALGELGDVDLAGGLVQ